VGGIDVVVDDQDAEPARLLRGSQGSVPVELLFWLTW